MGNSKHAPEPYEAEGIAIYEKGDQSGDHIAMAKDPIHAGRIVACVNACAGIPNEVLELCHDGSQAGNLKSILSENKELIQKLEDLRKVNYRLAERSVFLSDMLLHIKRSGAINPSSKLWNDIELALSKNFLDQIPSIHWISVKKELPRINKLDKFDVEHKISERVLCFHKQ